jgi:hypothetical protein
MHARKLVFERSKVMEEALVKEVPMEFVNYINGPCFDHKELSYKRLNNEVNTIERIIYRKPCFP